MDELERQPAASAGSETIQAQIDSLRHLVNSILILVIILSGSFNLYLYRQVKYTRTDLASIKPQATAMINEYAKVSQPLMKDFVNKLTEYSKTHPDFAPIAAKYKLNEATEAMVAPGSAAKDAKAKK